MATLYIPVPSQWAIRIFDLRNIQNLCFHALWPNRFIRRSVHSAKFQFIRRNSGPFGGTPVHSAGFRSIRPPNGLNLLKITSAEWTELLSKLQSIRRNSGPFGKTYRTSHLKNIFYSVHSANSLVHSAQPVHSAPNGLNSEAQGPCAHGPRLT